VIQLIEVQLNSVINYKKLRINQVHQMDFSLDNIRMCREENKIKLEKNLWILLRCKDNRLNRIIHNYDSNKWL